MRKGPFITDIAISCIYQSLTMSIIMATNRHDKMIILKYCPP